MLEKQIMTYIFPEKPKTERGSINLSIILTSISYT